MADWTEKMREGMRLMKEACAANTEGNKCRDCPFDSYCDILMEFGSKTEDDFAAELPNTWEA